MKPKQDKQKVEPRELDEAYKQVSGAPAIDAVSQAAMGNPPQTDKEKRMQDFTHKTSQLNVDTVCKDIEEAYAHLFEGLAGMMRFAHETSEPAPEPDSKED